MDSFDSDLEQMTQSVRANRRPWWVFALGFLGVLTLSLILLSRILGVSSWWIPSEAMEPSLSREDRVLTWSWGDVERGDIVVFDRPQDVPGAAEQLIKRAIAMPGERISFEDDRVHIDGVLLDEPYLDLASSSTVGEAMVVPEGHIYVLGDNRTASADSRFFGPISLDLLVSNQHWVWNSG